MHTWLHELNWAWIAFVLVVGLITFAGLGLLAIEEALHHRPPGYRHRHRVHIVR
jgi:hypothetical protein